jgi:Glutamine synthetase, catalytic domain
MSGGALEGSCHGLQVRSGWPSRPFQPVYLPTKELRAATCWHAALCSHSAVLRLQEAGEQFLAGVLRHLPGIVAFLAASPNSYRRLVPSAWAGAFQVPSWRTMLLQGAAVLPSLITCRCG